MALSGSPTRPTSARPKKVRRPDPSRVYQSFCYERSLKAWGAYTRTGQAHGLSDDTVRRIVAKFEKLDDTPPELQYQPLDADYEQLRPILAQQQIDATRPETLSVILQSMKSARPVNDPTPAQTAVDLPVELAPEPDYVAALTQEFTPLGTETERNFMSSISDINGVFERETRKFDEPTWPQMPQVDTSNFRAPERGQLSHNPGKFPHPSPTRSYPPRLARPGVNMAALVAQVFQPGPILAVILFAILIGLMYWK